MTGLTVSCVIGLLEPMYRAHYQFFRYDLEKIVISNNIRNDESISTPVNLFLLVRRQQPPLQLEK